MKRFYFLMAAIGMVTFVFVMGICRSDKESENKVSNSNFKNVMTETRRIGNSATGEKSSGRLGDRKNREFERQRAEREHDISVSRYELAVVSSKFKPEAFGENLIIRKKFQHRFDEWGLSKDQQDEIIRIMTQHSIDTAKVYLDSAIKWTQEVGHASQRQEDRAHTTTKLNQLNSVKAKTLNELAGIVDEGVAVEILSGKVR